MPDNPPKSQSNLCESKTPHRLPRYDENSGLASEQQRPARQHPRHQQTARQKNQLPGNKPLLINRLFDFRHRILHRVQHGSLGEAGVLPAGKPEGRHPQCQNQGRCAQHRSHATTLPAPGTTASLTPVGSKREAPAPRESESWLKAFVHWNILTLHSFLRAGTGVPRSAGTPRSIPEILELQRHGKLMGPAPPRSRTANHPGSCP